MIVDERGVLVTAAEAAALAQVSTSTVASWHARGQLDPVARLASRGRPWLYRAHEVLAVERATRLSDTSRRRARRVAQSAAREL